MLNTFDDISAIGTGKSSSRLAAFRAANGRDHTGRNPPQGATGKAPVRATAPAASSASITIAPKAAPKAAAPTAAQIEQARRRARHDAVMNSPQAKDRQARAASLIGGAPNLSAAEIIAMLPTMPTDAQAVEIAKRARISDMWDRAIAANAGKPRPAETASAKIWESAMASNARKPESKEAGDVWDRVIAGMK